MTAKFSKTAGLSSVGLFLSLTAPLVQAEDVPTATLSSITFSSDESYDAPQTPVINVQDSVKTRQASTLNDILDDTAGVQVSGSNIMNQRIRIRGVDDTDLKVTVDGARQESHLFYHSTDLAIDPALLKRAKVHVGNNSVTLGNHALGGGVEFTTIDATDMLDADQKIGAMVKSSYNSNNDSFANIISAYGKLGEKADALVAYTHTDMESGEDANGNMIQNYGSATSEAVLAKANIYPTANQKIGIGYQNISNEGLYPRRPDAGISHTLNKRIGPEFQTFDRETYTLNYDFTPSADLSVNANAYYTELKMVNHNTRGKTGDEGGLNFKGWIQGGKVEANQQLSTKNINHNLVYGAEYYEKKQRHLTQNKEDGATSWAAYAEDQLQFGKLKTTLGARFDYYESPKLVANGKNYYELLGGLGLEYELSPNLSVFGNYTQLFNGPNLVAASLNANEFYSDPNLEAETGDNKEIGLKSTWQNLLRPADNLNLTAKYFRTDFDNKIENIRAGALIGGTWAGGVDCATGRLGGACAGNINGGEAKITGYEIVGQYDINNWSVDASYSSAETTYKQTGEHSGNDTGDKFSLGINYSPITNLQIGMKYNNVQELAGADPAKPSYQTYDVFASYSPSNMPKVKFDVGVYNLTNEFYRDHSSNSTDYEPGRTFKVSMMLNTW